MHKQVGVSRLGNATSALDVRGAVEAGLTHTMDMARKLFTFTFTQREEP